MDGLTAEWMDSEPNGWTDSRIDGERTGRMDKLDRKQMGGQ